MQKGQKLDKKHHKIEFKLPEGFLGQFGSALDNGIPRARIVGAVAAGVGAYLLVRTTQKVAGDIVRTSVGVVTGFFEAAFNLITGPFIGLPLKPGALTPGFSPGLTKEQEALVAADPFAISIGLITGGMILAGQNPGEILKGIGEIIPG